MANQGFNSNRRQLVAAGLSAPLVMVAGQTRAAAYPSRPIELIVPFGPGGGADQMGRAVASMIEGPLKVSVPVINVPGATGNTGMVKMLSSAADGYSMCILIGDTLATIAKGGRWKIEDTVAVGILMQQSTGLFVKSDSPIKNFDDLLNQSKTRDIKIATVGLGSADDLHIGQMNAKGSRFRAVPYSNPGERYSTILGGHTEILIEQGGDVKRFLDSGQMRQLVIFSDQEDPNFKGVPLAKASGFNLAISQFRSIVMKAGTDPKAVQIVSDALSNAAKSAEFKKFLADTASFPASFLPASEANAFLKREMKLLSETKF
jgi:tripartite-type tricarboxylate transporter receptor subunit TctC